MKLIVSFFYVSSQNIEPLDINLYMERIILSYNIYFITYLISDTAILRGSASSKRSQKYGTADSKSYMERIELQYYYHSLTFVYDRLYFQLYHCNIKNVGWIFTFNFIR